MRVTIEVHPWTALGLPKRWRVVLDGRQHSVHETEADAVAAAEDLRRRTAFSWREGTVDSAGDHFELRYGPQGTEPEEWTPVAQVGPPVDNVFPVRWMIDRNAPENETMVRAVTKALDSYLTQVGGTDPWAYAQYHCGTMSNWYGDVHWASWVRPESP